MSRTLLANLAIVLLGCHPNFRNEEAQSAKVDKSEASSNEAKLALQVSSKSPSNSPMTSAQGGTTKPLSTPKPRSSDRSPVGFDSDAVQECKRQYETDTLACREDFCERIGQGNFDFVCPESDPGYNSCLSNAASDEEECIDEASEDPEPSDTPSPSVGPTDPVTPASPSPSGDGFSTRNKNL